MGQQNGSRYLQENLLKVNINLKSKFVQVSIFLIFINIWEKMLNGICLKVVTESPAITWLSLLSSIGGSLGLF